PRRCGATRHRAHPCPGTHGLPGPFAQLRRPDLAWSRFSHLVPPRCWAPVTSWMRRVQSPSKPPALSGGRPMLGVNGVEVRGAIEGRQEEILTAEALAFLAELQRRFNPRREQLLRARIDRQERLAAGEAPGFLEATREVRESEWKTARPPDDLLDRRVEITGPVE